MRFKAALFDMDGTLLDTIEDLADSMNAVLDQMGFPSHDVESYKYFVGDGMDQLVRRAFPEQHRDPRMLRLGLEKMRRDYSVRWRNKTRVYDGITDLLEGIRNAGMKAVILTNKPEDFAKEMARELLSDCDFDITRGARPDVPKKPDPTAALEIAENLGIAPDEFIYFGDTAVDMTTARSAGMYAVGVLWGFRGAAELIESGARILTQHPGDLLAWL